jgi:hypothetical protein
MRRQDGQARALFRLLTMPILAALKNADVIQAEDGEGGDEEATFCKDLLMAPPPMGGMSHTLSRFIQQMLLALFNGFSAWEMVYWVPDTGPNKGKITLRKLDWRPSETLTFLLDGQGEFNGFRQRTFFQGRTIDVKIPKETALYYACFVAETRVVLLDGTQPTMRELVQRYDSGEQLWAYSLDDRGRVVPGRVTRAQKTGVRRVVAVTLDNGEVVRCTPDHRWMLRDGTYRQAADLKSGDSLMPFYRRERPVGRSKKLYEQVYVPGENKYRFTHRAVGDFIHGPGRTGWVTHHVNLNDHDNSPGNLWRITNEEHRRIHADLCARSAAALTELWADPERRAVQEAKIRAAMDTPEWKAAHRAGTSTPEFREQCRKSGSWGRNTSVSIEVIDAVYAKMPMTARDMASALSTDLATVRRRVIEAGYGSWADYVARRHRGKRPVRKSRGQPAPAVSSRLRQQWQDPGYREARSAESSSRLAALWADPEWKASQVAKLRAGRAQRRDQPRACENCGQVFTPAGPRAKYCIECCDRPGKRVVNHKVVSVEWLGEEREVFDLTVDRYHNFALASGAWVHNCNESERPFYGVSMFEAAFFHYDKKVKLYYISHLAAQRAAVGTRVGTMKPNPAKSDKDAFIAALANLGLAQYIALPDADWTVQNLEEKGNFDFLGLINHHNSQMSKSVLAQWFDETQGSGQGDSALVDFGNQDDATWLMMLDGLLAEMAEVIDNHIFPRFVDWNFGTGNYPKWKWGDLTAEQKAAIQDTFDKLAVAGQTANVTPEFMLEIEQRMAEDLGLDIDYEKIKKEREKQQKLMQQQAQAQAQMMQNGQPVAAGSSVTQPGAPPAPGGGGGAPAPGGPSGAPAPGPNPRPGPGGPYG